MFSQPLVNLWFYLALALSILSSSTWSSWGLHLGIFLVVAYFQRHRLSRPGAGARLRPLLRFLPLLAILYVVFSFLFSEATPGEILGEALFSLLKLILMVLVMATFIESASSLSVLNALRSLWTRTNLDWRWVDDWFLFLGLSLRFFPTFQRNWERDREARRSLGLEGPRGRFAAPRAAARDLPALVLYSLRRAEDTALAMGLRGYGLHHPRGVVHPLPFKLLHGVQIVVITLFFWWI